ncbi:ABC transporter substrate-binding protein [Nonomuraea sp. NPDC049480]|uniref:ABC transporter substrate-binding protein n=1 Tax=Nonomuraea sp. NPDC049480 TaxID=3364353 RepID=UPI00379B798A
MRGVRPLRPGDPPSVGSYKVTGFLGEGGQGSVYLGVSPGGEQVAIKLLHARFADDEHAVRRFRREAAAARRVAEFCTARVLEVGTVNDQPYIVSEYVDGPSLQYQVTREEPVRGPSLMRLAITTATALVAIHGAGVVHRDFKPSNVLLGPDGPRVIDFGIARALDLSQSLTTSIVGTPAFMAPEQFLGEALPAGDVFAWAGTMVFAATGRGAFGLGPLPVLMHRILHLDPDLSGVPPELAPLLWACLAKDPHYRPTAGQLISDLIRAGTTPPTSSRRLAPSAPPPAVRQNAPPPPSGLQHSDPPPPPAALRETAPPPPVSARPLGSGPTGPHGSPSSEPQAGSPEPSTSGAHPVPGARPAGSGPPATPSAPATPPTGPAAPATDGSREEPRRAARDAQGQAPYPAGDSPAEAHDTADHLQAEAHDTAGALQAEAYDVAAGAQGTAPDATSDVRSQAHGAAGAGQAGVMPGVGGGERGDGGRRIPYPEQPVSGPHAPAHGRASPGWPMSPRRLGVTTDPSGRRRRPRVRATAGAAAVTLAVGVVVWLVAQLSPPIAVGPTSTTAPMSSFPIAGFGAAVATVVSPSAREGGTLRVVSALSPESADPGDMYLPDSLNLVRLYGRTLTMFRTVPGTAGTQVVPDLAESLGVPSDGGRTWTYRLRDGLRYEDGTLITAHDVKHAILRSMDPDFVSGSSYFDLMLDLPSGYQGAYRSADVNTDSAIEVPDDETIIFHLKKPYAAFDNVVQLPETIPVPAAKDTRGDYGKSVVASGPYKLESVTDRAIVLVRNQQWDAATDPNRRPLPARYEVAYSVEQREAERRLRTGEAEVGPSYLPGGMSGVLGDPALKERADAPVTGLVHVLAINPQVPPFDDVECRRAVVRALDLNALRRPYGTDVTDVPVPTSLLPPVIAGRRHADPNLKPGGDRQAAKDSLAACGRASGFAATYLYRDVPSEKQAAETVKAALAEVGIKLTLRAAPVLNFHKDQGGNPAYLKKNGIGLIAKTWGPDWPDPDAFLALIADSREITEESSINVSVRVDAIDDLMDRARTEPDAAQRAELWTQVERRLAEEAVLVPLSWHTRLLLRGKHATNVHVSPVYGEYDLLTMGVVS